LLQSATAYQLIELARIEAPDVAAHEELLARRELVVQSESDQRIAHCTTPESAMANPAVRSR